MKLIGLCGVAAVVAVSGAFVHNAYRPFGLILSIAATLSVIVVARLWASGSIAIAVNGLCWLVPVVVIAMPRPEGDVVIESTFTGLAFVFCGAMAYAVAMGLGPVRSARREISG